MRAVAGFHLDQAGRQVGKELRHLAAFELLAAAALSRRSLTPFQEYSPALRAHSAAQLVGCNEGIRQSLRLPPPPASETAWRPERACIPSSHQHGARMRTPCSGLGGRWRDRTPRTSAQQGCGQPGFHPQEGLRERSCSKRLHRSADNSATAAFSLARFGTHPWYLSCQQLIMALSALVILSGGCFATPEPYLKYCFR